MYNKVIIKISGEGLSGKKDQPFDDKTINRIVKEINTLIGNGVQVSIVVGGGNFWRGRDAKSQLDKTRADHMGMLATIMNGVYLSEAFRIYAENNTSSPCKKAVVMTPYDVNAFTERFSKDKALEYMSDMVVPIFAGGTGHPFFSTDSIVAIRACELDVDCVLYGKSVKSVYDCDPKKNKKARRYKTISYENVIGNNLDVADISAVSLTSKENIPSVVFALSKTGAIEAAASGLDEALEKAGGTKIAVDIDTVFYEK